jgi:hypothetical protein
MNCALPSALENTWSIFQRWNVSSMRDSNSSRSQRRDVRAVCRLRAVASRRCDLRRAVFMALRLFRSGEGDGGTEHELRSWLGAGAQNVPDRA